jgi:molybdenum cofactor cytidylyltransferase
VIPVLVLAAGRSARMGEDKLLLDVGGAPLLRRAARAALDAAVGPVLVVLAAGAARARAEVAGLGCSVVPNPDPDRGMNSSLACGVAAVPDRAEALVVVLADMPLVTAPMLVAVAERFRATGAPIVASRYGEVLAPPVLYGRRLFGDLAAGGAGDGRGRELVRAAGAGLALCDWPADALVDVDDPASLAAARARLAAAGGPPDPPGA